MAPATGASVTIGFPFGIWGDKGDGVEEGGENG